MRNETAAQKEKRMFNFYKSDLERLGEKVGSVRMNVIEYVCSFPKIDPYKMAAAIVSDGFEVLFDDSSISRRENERKRKAIEKLTA
jgi:hypothetical protein|nr:MAG TPA: hypothetical protein [Bacteriophage sp.]